MASESNLSQLFFFAAAAASGAAMVRVIIPPNRTPTDRAWTNDSLWFARSNGFINLAIGVATACVVYHCLLCASPPAAVLEALCPFDGSGQRNLELFTWSPVTAAAFAAILVGAPLRMGAFTGLGKNFTFGLAKPRGLVTDGIYAHLQHPSYTGMFLVAVGSYVAFLRFDGSIACVVPPQYWPLVQAWSTTVYAGLGLLLVQQIVTRVVQEEAMLKELFGKEWEEWHAKTSRFVPGLF